MHVRGVARLAICLAILPAAAGCSPLEPTQARCAGLNLDDCRLVYEAALTEVAVEMRERIVDWHVAETSADFCGPGEPLPLLDVVFSLRTSLQPFIVAVGRDAQGRAQACPR